MLALPKAAPCQHTTMAHTLVHGLSVREMVVSFSGALLSPLCAYSMSFLQHSEGCYATGLKQLMCNAYQCSVLPLRRYLAVLLCPGGCTLYGPPLPSEGAGLCVVADPAMIVQPWTAELLL